jgi:hypothetical protein
MRHYRIAVGLTTSVPERQYLISRAALLYQRRDATGRQDA